MIYSNWKNLVSSKTRLKFRKLSEFRCKIMGISFSDILLAIYEIKNAVFEPIKAGSPLNKSTNIKTVQIRTLSTDKYWFRQESGYQYS